MPSRAAQVPDPESESESLRILWVCHYFVPEIGAMTARLMETSRVFLDRGCSVGAVTCFANHPLGELAAEDRGRWFRHDVVEGVDVYRCWSFVTPNRGFVRKILGHLSFMVTSLWGLHRAYRHHRPDVVVVSSPTFFSVCSTWFWCSLRRTPWVFDVRDLWPGIFVDLGVLKNRFLIGLLERIELFLYRRASRVVGVTEGFARDIEQRAKPKEPVEVVFNGVDCDRFSPGPKDQDLLKAHDLEDRFVVLYIGTHGIQHGLDRVLEAAALMQADDPVEGGEARGRPAFVLVGEGAEKESLQAQARALDLGDRDVRFLPSVPTQQVVQWLRSADVALVPRRGLEGFRTFVPAKMFEILACGVPLVSNVEGEAAEILERSGGAVVVPPEDAAMLASAIRSLQQDVERRQALGRAGREFVAREFSRRSLGERYLEVLEDVVGQDR